MSYVTNVILSFSIMEYEKDRLAEINAFFERQHGYGFSNGFLNDHHGATSGTKALEIPILVAAFNYFDEEDFIEHLRTIPWAHPEDVQLFLCRQEEDHFELLWPCEKRTTVARPLEEEYDDESPAAPVGANIAGPFVGES